MGFHHFTPRREEKNIHEKNPASKYCFLRPASEDKDEKKKDEKDILEEIKLAEKSYESKVAEAPAPGGEMKEWHRNALFLEGKMSEERQER